ncbi:MAG TPA: hypothetical protein VKE22_30565 [Haliangiales bacterium]|nr:hypothetical protein [Haliangiales bacterium]
MRSVAWMVAVLVALASPSAGAQAAKKKKEPAPAETAPAAPVVDERTSMVVTVRHLNGEKEVFSSDVDSMDLIFDSTGKLTMIHLVLFSVSGTERERDTHRFFLVQNLASFNYQFRNVSGKGKVRLKVMQPFEKSKAETGTPEIPAVVPNDYR